MRYIKRYGIWIFWGIITAILVVLAFSPAHHFTFSVAYSLKRFFGLFFGILYPAVSTLSTISSFLTLIVSIGMIVIVWGIWRLWRARRYPMLIFVTALIGANILFFGTGHFLDMGRVRELIIICEDYRLSPKVTLQIMRYPIEARLRDDAQTFVLMSDDERRTWRQILSAYAVNPNLGGCDHIQAEFNNDRTWSILLQERRGNTFQNDMVRYTTTDGGLTFTREIE